MPSLINQPGSGTDIAANYRKSFAPFTLFGTRQLRFYFIYIYGLNVTHPDNGGDHGYANAYEYPFGGPYGWDGENGSPNFGVDSAFARVVSSIQTQAEIYGVWHPDADNFNAPTSDSWFTVMVAGDTHADAQMDGIGDNSIKLQQAIYEALDGTSCYDTEVRQAYIWGDNLNEDIGTSISKGANKMSLSPEDQAKADALKAARAAVRPSKPKK
jgi:hypothetical protein